ncbi:MULTISPECIES: TSUP family transporter [unclassified Micromonospora]|uniref:sulfite exporter TauE/SafE family protein n=1 Tax=unclassified Micromonospora TaxID=2617518 RepID=UPI00362EB656
MTVDDLPARKNLRNLRTALLFNLGIAVVVIFAWFAVGGVTAIGHLREHWRIAVTMVFGSLVGGGTSEGGGAVAFPVFTKVLEIPATDARLFTYAIQSVGMTAASLSILFLRAPIERRVLKIGAPAGMVGVLLTTLFAAQGLPMASIRAYFTVLLTALGIALIVQQLRRNESHNTQVMPYGTGERIVIAIGGFVGGLVSGLVGVGENTVMFIVMVLLFRVSEKIATPTTVILMTVVSITAFFSHAVLLGTFVAPVTEYWQAAIPIVVIGAPLGTLIYSRMSRRTIRTVLIVLIAVELVSTIFLVRIPTTTIVISVGLLATATAACVLMTQVRRYRPWGTPPPFTVDTVTPPPKRRSTAITRRSRTAPWTTPPPDPASATSANDSPNSTPGMPNSTPA